MQFAMTAVSSSLLVATSLLLATVFSLYVFVSSLITPSRPAVSPPSGSFSVIYVVGAIQGGSGNALGTNEPSYLHGPTVEYIKSLADNPDDKGILLYMNTGGGGVYESDEMYRALMEYKEKTGRPIYAYMANICASGGYYISMAADRILANYNTTTGSIGVYIALTDTSGLYEKLGIETVLVRSGENKGVGTNGVEITDAQRDVYQSIVDESYERFLSLVKINRGMSDATLRPLADGRIYTANQALGHGLVDELCDWKKALEIFEEKTGGTPFYTGFSRQTTLGSLLGNIPKSDIQAMIELVQEVPSGVPMSWAPVLMENVE